MKTHAKIERVLRVLDLHEIASDKSEKSNRIANIVNTAYHKLTKEEKDVIRLRYFLNFTIGETMDELKMKRWKVFSSRKSALDKFAIAFAGSEDLLDYEVQTKIE